MYVSARSVGDGEYRSRFLDPLIEELELCLLLATATAITSAAVLSVRGQRRAWISGRNGSPTAVLGIAREVFSCLDVGVSGHALLKLRDLLQYWVHHPAHVHRHFPEVEAFTGISDEVEHHGQLDVCDGFIDGVGLAENNLEVLPLHRHQLTVKTEIQDGIPAGGVLLAQQIVGGVDTIDGAVGGHAS